ncbi:MAG: hypothetical protein J6V40_05365, partial [Clostridia bacterium]|nr:hypothetical protein [Clostridia bacterium]
MSKTLSVKTFIPVVYPTVYSQDFDERWQGTDTTMPLNVEIDKLDEAYLGDMSLLYTVDPVTGDYIYDTATSSSTISVPLQKLTFNGTIYYVEDWNHSYTTFTDLIITTNSSIDLNVFNYLLFEDADGRKQFEKINVNSSVTASYSILNYLEWSNGVLTTYSNRTINKNTPVKLSLNYYGDVEYFDIENGVYYTESVKVTHVINVWVYDIISTVDLVSSKNVTLYDSNSLGYYDSSSCSYDIEVEVNPEVEYLGGWVSEANALYGVNMIYNVNDKYITTIYNDNRTNRVEVMLSDLYKIEGNTITATIGQKVLDFLNDPNVTQSLEEILAMIYRNKVSFNVNIYVTQFDKSTAINSILVTLDFAKMVEDIYLDVDSDGLYFEVREDGEGNLQAYPTSLSVDYVVNPDIAYNRNVRLINYITSSYYVLEGNVVSNGMFTVVPKLSAGEYSIIVAAEDSFYTLGSDTYYFNTYKTLKVKVADGSKEYPFEIRTVQDFEQMLDDVNNGLNYHYVLVNDINLAGYQFKNYTFKNTTDEFVLDGEYQYVSNGIIMYRYSTIYGLNVLIDAAATERVVDEDADYVNLGLFTSIPQVATIKNITFKNASLNATLSATFNTKTYNVGMIAGLCFGSMLNSQVSGNVQISLNTCSNVNVGGVFGYLGNPALFYGDGVNVDAFVSGYPCQMDDNVAESSYNANVSIKILGSNLPTSNINIGGYAGYADLAGLYSGNIANINVAMSISSNVYATIGGVVGRANNVYLLDTTVVPIIWNDTNVDGVANLDKLNLGGLFGYSYRSYVENSIVYFNDLGTAFVGLSSTSIYGNGNLGGFVGYSDGDTFVYSYVRSFYDDIISVESGTAAYYGNIVVASKGNAGGFI